jgi:hypothetical protein
VGEGSALGTDIIAGQIYSKEERQRKKQFWFDWSKRCLIALAMSSGEHHSLWR